MQGGVKDFALEYFIQHSASEISWESLREVVSFWDGTLIPSSLDLGVENFVL